MRSTQRSTEAYQQASRVIPGGVDSPVRAAWAVSSDPVFIARGSGAYIWDIDDNSYIDYVGSWGPLILGHAHPAVVEAVQAVAAQGLSFGAPTKRETELAEELTRALPSLQMVRLVNSGTEASMSALRLARGATGRELIVKFEGCYHGHSDGLLVKAGSGALTFGTPTSAGVPESIAGTTLVAAFNDQAGIEALFKQYGTRIAAVIVEPVAGNMGVVLPQEGFLSTLRELTAASGSLLIFDEVMTGFRVAYGGAQTLFGIEPDITCLGKIIGGGLPLAAYGGKADLMQQLAPLGPVYQAGTLSGNPLAVTAGLATLAVLRQEGFYDELKAKTSRLVEGIRVLASKHNIALQLNALGGMFSVHFTSESIRDLRSASSSSSVLYAAFYRALLSAGIYIPPSPFESWFSSIALSHEDIDATLSNIEQVFLSNESFISR